MSRDYEFTSPYYNEVRYIIEGWRVDGVGQFLPEDLANAMGRKVTPSMRNALKVAVERKLVKKFGFFTPNGGRAIGYLILQPNESELEQMEMPF